MKPSPGKPAGKTVCSFWCVLFFLVSLSAAYGFLGSRPLFGTSEGRYAECAREMMVSGNYLEPTLDYQPHFSKPPLTYWAIVLGMKLWGINEWGARWMSGTAFFLTSLLVSFLGTLWWGRTVGWMAGTIYATSLLPLAGGFTLTTDMLLTLWETAAVLGYVMSLQVRSRGRKHLWIIFMWLMFGAAFLTKGPPGLLPLLPILVYQWRFKPDVPIGSPVGLFLFVITGFSWFAVVCHRHPELVSYYLGQEIVGRLSGHVSGHRTHNAAWYKSFKVYLPPLLIGSGAWSWYLWKNFVRKKLWQPSELRGRLKKPGPAAFTLLWFLIPLVIFWFSGSKLTLYILPLSVPLTLAVTRWFTLEFPPGLNRRKFLVLTLASLAVFLTVKATVKYAPNHNNIHPLLVTCRSMDTPETTWVGFGERKWYKLQFYFGERFLYCHASDDFSEDRINHVSCRELARRIKTSPHPFGVICHKKKFSMFRNIMHENGLAGRIVTLPYWNIILFNEKSGEKGYTS